MDYDDFSNYPKSVTEAKANRKIQGAGDQTPRDALIAALRALDSGEYKPHALIVIAACHKDDLTTGMEYFNAIPNTFYGIGMMNAGIKDFMEF